MRSRTAIACIAALLSVPGVLLAQPTVVSVSPASGNGLQPTFTATYSDPGGFANITEALLLVNTVVAGPNVCYMRYYAPTNAFYVTDNAAGDWQAPVTPGSASTTENSQCKLYGSASSKSGSGNTLTLNFGVAFKNAGFSGLKNVFLYAVSPGGASG